MELPFKLSKDHKKNAVATWKTRGLIHDDYDALYQAYIYATNCDLCGIEFKNKTQRQMNRNRDNGEFCNFTCISCKGRKIDIRMNSNNKSGYKCIYKQMVKGSKQGFTWIFQPCIDGKRKRIKSSIDKEKLIKFADKWKIDNKYNT
tara:strand:- start:2824 stop:3261 length:438 start_codon:yes stop_codon:yes gene_type:complete